MPERHIRRWFVLAVASFFPASVLQADSWDPHVVVLATTTDLASAAVEAERASNLLGYGIDYSSLAAPDSPRKAEGQLISVRRTPAGLLEILGYLGDESQIKDALNAAHEFYPTARTRPAPHAVATYYLLYRRRGVVVAGSYRSYEAAREAAKALEAASGMPLGTRGLVYDEARGLHWPGSEDDPDSSSFYYRRYDSDCSRDLEAPCLTVEPSDAYPGFESGYFVVVAGVLDRGPKREARLEAVREYVPDAFVKETNLWMGCAH